MGSNQEGWRDWFSCSFYPLMSCFSLQEVERSNFWLEVPKIIKRFWLAIIFSFLCLAMVAVFSTSLLPYGWSIPPINWAVVFPVVYVNLLEACSTCLTAQLHRLVASGHILFPVSTYCHLTTFHASLTNYGTDRFEPLAHDIFVLILIL